MASYYNDYWKNKESLGDTEMKWPIISRVIPSSGSFRLLDFGCGKGTILRRVVNQNSSIHPHGIDISSDAITSIRKYIPKGSFHTLADGEAFPYKDGYFDWLIASDVLEHVYHTDFTWNELSRVLKSGGHAFFSVPYHGLFKHFLIGMIAFDFYFKPNQPHIRFYTKTNFKQYIQLHNFEIIEFGYYGRFYPVSHGMYAVCKKKNL